MMQYGRTPMKILISQPEETENVLKSGLHPEQQAENSI